MPSPDISNYIDLTVYDLQPSEVYDASVEYAQTALPEWTPVAGSIEDAILQATSSMTAFVAAAINRLPAGNVEGLLRLFGVERNSGTAPTATVNIVFIDASNRTIPAGTRFGYLDNTEAEPVLYVFETIDTVTTSAGSITAAIEGISFIEYPSISSGTQLQLLSAVSSIQSVTLTSNLSVGADPETQTEFINRGIAKFASLSESLATESQFAAYALVNYSSVYRAKGFSRLKIETPITSLTSSGASVTAEVASGHEILAGDYVRVFNASDTTYDGYFEVQNVDSTHVYWSQDVTHASASATGAILTSHALQDPVDGNYTPTNGYATLYVSDLDGASVSASTLAEIEEEITDKAIGGLIFRVDNAKVANLNVNISYTLKSGNLAAVVSASVAAAVESYINPNNWPWSQDVYVNEIIALVDRVSGVERVVSVTITDPDNSGTVDEGTGNFLFDYVGVLPLATATVTVS
jgi:hypothetical protein